LTWNPNPEMDLAGYKVYQSTTSGLYGDPIAIVESVTTYVGTLRTEHDTKYYFIVTAFDKSGKESAKSEEVSKLIRGTKVVAGTPR
jgi:endoglucanase